MGAEPRNRIAFLLVQRVLQVPSKPSSAKATLFGTHMKCFQHSADAPTYVFYSLLQIKQSHASKFPWRQGSCKG